MKAVTKSAEMYVCYTLLQLIGKKYTEFDAYKLGLIDDRGEILRKSKTKEEKEALSFVVILALNFKKTAMFNPVFYQKLKINPILAMRESLNEYALDLTDEMIIEMISGDASADPGEQAAGMNSGNVVHVTSKDNVPDNQKGKKKRKGEVVGATPDEKKED